MALKKNYFKKHTNSPIKLHHIDPEKLNKKKVIVESTAVTPPQFGTAKDTIFFNKNEASNNLLSILNNKCSSKFPLKNIFVISLNNQNVTK